MKLLNIIASPRGNKSRSIAVASELLDSLKIKYPDLKVKKLDLFTMNLPEVFGGSVDAKYAFINGVMPNDDAMVAWNEITRYSQEFAEADIYLIATPMWNFSIPYKLKQYIDIIMQAGTLFRFTEYGVEGLAKNKKMFCVTSRGNDYSAGGVMHQFDFQEPYLRSIFGFAGITDISFINAQPLDMDPGVAAASVEKAISEAKIIALA